jgi:hypothetical protein
VFRAEQTGPATKDGQFDVPYGITVDQLKKQRKVEQDPKLPETVWKDTATTVWGRPVSLLGYRFIDGKLAIIVVVFKETSDKLALVEDMAKVYGDPVVQPVSGAVYFRWDLPKGKVIVEIKPGSTQDAYLYTVGYIAEGLTLVPGSQSKVPGTTGKTTSL